MGKATSTATPGWPNKRLILGMVLVLQLAVMTVMFVMSYQPEKWRMTSAIKVQVDSSLNSTSTVSRNASPLAALDMTTVAIGMGLTTRGTDQLSIDNLDKTLLFFKTLMPSFCQTCSAGFKYNFFVAYDFDDPFLNDNQFLKAFNLAFKYSTEDNCPNGSTYSLHFVKCNHTKSPGWAQNDAMMAAYFSNMAYLYRINDDSDMITPGWTEVFINALEQMDPPGVGVVGPEHTGGNTLILTHEFVSHYHVDIFGFYYPRVFSDWYGDKWVTLVYRPDRSKKLESVKLAHRKTLGRRYKEHIFTGDIMAKQIAMDNVTLSRYITSVRSAKHPSRRYIVSVSLSGNKSVNTYGAVWYAQHIRSYLPDWTLRVYVDNSTEKHKVPSAILQKLTYLGAQIAIIPVKMALYPSSSWRHLVVSDEDVDAFLIRDVTSRFTERESVILDAWITNMTNNPVYCVRDHPDHAALPIIDGLWGGSYLHSHDLRINLTRIFFPQDVNDTTPVNSQDILKNQVWPLIQGISACFDSVSCQSWPGSIPFPTLRQNDEWVGRMYNQHGVADPSQSVAL